MTTSFHRLEKTIREAVPLALQQDERRREKVFGATDLMHTSHGRSILLHELTYLTDIFGLRPGSIIAEFAYPLFSDVVFVREFDYYGNSFVAILPLTSYTPSDVRNIKTIHQHQQRITKIRH